MYFVSRLVSLASSYSIIKKRMTSALSRQPPIHTQHLSLRVIFILLSWIISLFESIVFHCWLKMWFLPHWGFFHECQVLTPTKVTRRYPNLQPTKTDKVMGDVSTHIQAIERKNIIFLYFRRFLSSTRRFALKSYTRRQNMTSSGEVFLGTGRRSW